MGHYRYSQSTGRLTLVADDGTETLIGTGWAGNDYRPDTNRQGLKGYNNPLAQFIKFVGPLNRGWYTIGPAQTHPTLGPVAMPLLPDAENDMQGRGSFWMHGASAQHPEQSSEGCIIQSHVVRVGVSTSGITRLEVVA